MNFNKYIIFSILFIVSFSSCKKKIKLDFASTPDVITGSSSISDYMSPADSVILDFKYLQAKMKTNATLNGKAQGFNALLRWEKGEKIWMSMSLFGIEGVRALVDRNSIQWIDKFNGEYHYLPMSKTASILKMDLDFDALERLLLGLPVIKDTIPMEVTTSEEWIKLYTIHPNGYTSSAIFNKINNMLIEYQANNASQERNLIAKYGDVRKIGEKQFAFDRSVNISQGNSSFEMESKISDIVILNELSFPFEISSSLKRIVY
ncbi:MAG TPA: DUF4292 domain-containing protein [Chitinophagales bacterium]|nr:DUF4292 domain-containing protein [Chitinophagales bacterium]